MAAMTHKRAIGAVLRAASTLSIGPTLTAIALGIVTAPGALFLASTTLGLFATGRLLEDQR
jgi:hypothetical protein